jgi:hypothetical protein
MNSYSFLERQLHKLVLSPKWLREAMFDFEKSMFLNGDYKTHLDHIFVTGLARSGTTTLLNAIYSSDKFGTLSYSDMPFLMAPNLWSLISFKNNDVQAIERAHKDGIRISKKSPEAFEEVFWKTFNADEETAQNFQEYIQLILINKNRRRYLSKNNQNIKRIDFLVKEFPKSFFLIPFRDPLQHSNSLLTQHINFCMQAEKNKFISQYMYLIGHSEFGSTYKPMIYSNIEYLDFFSLNHWLEQWYLTYCSLLKKLSNLENVIFICYEDLCDNPKTWMSLKNKLAINESLEFNFIKSQKNITKEFSNDLEKKCLDLYMQLKKNF